MAKVTKKLISLLSDRLYVTVSHEDTPIRKETVEDEQVDVFLIDSVRVYNNTGELWMLYLSQADQQKFSHVIRGSGDEEVVLDEQQCIESIYLNINLTRG